MPALFLYRRNGDGTMTDTETRLKKVRDAIETILTGGESYTVDGVSYKRGDLGKLQSYEEYLENKLEKESGRVRRVSRCRFPAEG